MDASPRARWDRNTSVSWTPSSPGTSARPRLSLVALAPWYEEGVCTCLQSPPAFSFGCGSVPVKYTYRSEAGHTTKIAVTFSHHQTSQSTTPLHGCRTFVRLNFPTHSMSWLIPVLFQSAHAFSPEEAHHDRSC